MKLKPHGAKQGRRFGGQCQREGDRTAEKEDDVEAGDVRE
jgi:hypothetical protein